MKKQRSTSIEILRVLFALWVVYYHGFLCTKPSAGFFNSGFLAVDFFFVLTGLFLIRSFAKYENNEKLNKRWDKGVFTFLWDKLKSLQIAIIVGLIFVLWYQIINKEFNPFHWGYLWFIDELLLYSGILYIAHFLIKNNKKYLIFCIVVFLIAYPTNFIFFEAKVGPFRALGGMTLGMIISYIPKIKSQKITIPFYFLFLIIAILYAFSPTKYLYTNFLIIVLCFCGLLYFASCVKFSNQYINASCTISFGLYAYQCVIRVIDFYHPLQNHTAFVILLSLVVVDRIIVYGYKYLIKLKSQRINVA